MKFQFLALIASILLIAPSMQADEGNADISFYTGTFDVIDKEGDDYKICSPYDDSIGWINKKQVSFTFYQNPKTQRPCK